MGKKIMTTALRIMLGIFGLFMVGESIFAYLISNLNLGIVMPFVIGLPLLILAVFYTPINTFFHSCVIGKIIKIAFISTYVLFLLLFAMTTTLILSAPVEADMKADYLIVLGAGIRGDYPSIVLRNRLDKACEYYSCNPNIKIIVSGGQGKDEPATEASVMKSYLISHGVSENIIIEESESQSTEQNFVFSKRIIDELEIGESPKIIFVTNKFHVYRAGLMAKSLGINARGIAARDYSRLTINNYLRECAALVQYFITGKI